MPNQATGSSNIAKGTLSYDAGDLAKSATQVIAQLNGIRSPKTIKIDASGVPSGSVVVQDKMTGKVIATVAALATRTIVPTWKATDVDGVTAAGVEQQPHCGEGLTIILNTTVIGQATFAVAGD